LPKFGCHGNSFSSLEILDSVFEFADIENPTIHRLFDEQTMSHTVSANEKESQ